MKKHPYFDLRLHDDDELASLLPAPVTVRSTIHEWPLSCVQKVLCADGSAWAYKTQARAVTVEPEFYAAARSELLLLARVIAAPAGHAALLLPWIDAPHPQPIDARSALALGQGQGISAHMRAIQGDLPWWLDVSTAERWRGCVESTIVDLRALVAANDFHLVRLEMIAALERRLLAPDVLAACAYDPGLVHGDLTPGNLFALPGGWRVIDWARPLRGPAALDHVTLLHACGFDPLPHFDDGLIWLWRGLRIHWLAGCAARWFPPGRETYDQQIAAVLAF